MSGLWTGLRVSNLRNGMCETMVQSFDHSGDVRNGKFELILCGLRVNTHEGHRQDDDVEQTTRK